MYYSESLKLYKAFSYAKFFFLPLNIADILFTLSLKFNIIKRLI